MPWKIGDSVLTYVGYGKVYQITPWYYIIKMNDDGRLVKVWPNQMTKD